MLRQPRRLLALGGDSRHVGAAIHQLGRSAIVNLRTAARASSQVQWQGQTGIAATVVRPAAIAVPRRRGTTAPAPSLALPVDEERAAAATDSLAAQYAAGVQGAIDDGDELAVASADALEELGPAIDRTAVTEAVDAWNDEAMVLAEGAVATTGMVLVQVWEALLDTRTCPECAALDGQARRFPARFDEVPPLHPRCRCFLSAYVDEVSAA